MTYPWIAWAKTTDLKRTSLAQIVLNLLSNSLRPKYVNSGFRSWPARSVRLDGSNSNSPPSSTLPRKFNTHGVGGILRTSVTP